MQECSSCGGLTLSRYVFMDGLDDPADVNPVVLFPTTRDIEDLPDRVKRRYARMMELRFDPDTFAVHAGRTLEAVCADQGFPRTDEMRNLYDRLDALVTQGEVPKPLVDQAHLVRDYRNIGGHDDVVDVEEAT